MTEEQNTQESTQAKNDPVATITDTLHSIFLAGVGAVAATGEKSSELFQQLVAKGEATVQQGKDANSELLKKARGKVSGTAEGALRDYLRALSPEERARFVESVQRAADAAEAEVADAAQDVAAEAATVNVEADEAAATPSDEE